MFGLQYQYVYPRQPIFDRENKERVDILTEKNKRMLYLKKKYQETVNI